MRQTRLNGARGQAIGGSLLGMFAVGLALASGGWLRASDSQAAAASLGATQTVYLEYREQAQGATSYGLQISTQSAAFKKEPALGLRKVVRGNLQFGSSADQFVPFIWDQHQGKLYLDLNRDQDFTDDAGGVFTCSGPLRYSPNYQTFLNVRLSFKTARGTHPALMDITLYDFNQVQGSYATRSYWAGKAVLQGKEWELGFVEDVAGNAGSTDRGYLLLRPWAERDRAFNLQDGSLDGFQFCRNVFFNGQALHLDCTSMQDGGAPRYRLALEPRQAELGELRVTGKFVKRLLLPGKSFTVVMDHPEPVVKVPVGSYGHCQVQLKQGSAEAYRQMARFAASSTGNATTISARQPTVLNVGGPLTNSVTVGRRGRALNLSYQLLGAGGETYQFAGCPAAAGVCRLPGRQAGRLGQIRVWLRRHVLVLMARTLSRRPVN